MSVRESVFAESFGTFSIAVLGGVIAKSTHNPIQNLAVVVTTAAFEVMRALPGISAYLDLPPATGWGQRVLSFGSTFVRPALFLGIGLCVGAAIEPFKMPDKPQLFCL